MPFPESHVILCLVMAGLTACHPTPPHVPEPPGNPEPTSSWSQTGSAGVSIVRYKPVLLPNGKVLVALGSGGPSQLYDPASGTWTSAGGEMRIQRFDHSVTLLPDGRVLAMGGRESAWRPPLTLTAELYDPATDSWKMLNPIKVSTPHTATLMSNGKVLVASVPDGAYWYAPTTDTWSKCTENRVSYLHVPLLLPSGKVLFLGGSNANETLRYDPRTDEWTSGFRPVPGIRNAAAVLHSGKVLVTWINDDSSLPVEASVYDPESDVWSSTGTMRDHRSVQALLTLRDGKVLAVVGADHPDSPYQGPVETELYDPDSGTWTLAGAMRGHGTPLFLTLLPSGKVLCTGPASKADLYTPP